MATEPQRRDDDELPPPGGNWRRLYWLLVLELGALTVAFYALTWWATA
jgi:hypothetical protein